LLDSAVLPRGVSGKYFSGSAASNLPTRMKEAEEKGVGFVPVSSVYSALDMMEGKK